MRGTQLIPHLARNPRDIPRLPRWIAERRSDTFDLRRPWWPYGTVNWIEKHLRPSARVLEFGGGGSSLWLLDRGAMLAAVEEQPEWAHKLEAAGVNVTLVEPTLTGTIQSASVPGFFDAYVGVADRFADHSLDLVIVDGRARVHCVQRAMPKVRPGGMLMLDDSDRPRYSPAIKCLTQWQRHIFRGLKPNHTWPTPETSVWQAPGP